MELLHISIRALVKEIKDEMLDIDPYSFVSPSAYDTAWLAMINPAADSNEPLSSPMFKACLDWVLNNQTEEGYWGECDSHGNPTIESLPATLACVIALKKWNVGSKNIERGLDFVHGNAEKHLGVTHDHFPRWFTIVFPGMIELAHKAGLELAFPSHLNELLSDIFYQRQRILETGEDIIMNLSGDGSLFQSPAATARAFMATGKEECLGYLESLVGRCATGVPPSYPLDEELIKLCVVNQLQRLGLADHFTHEIEANLAQLYWNYNSQEPLAKPSSNPVIATQLYKDSLAFRLLRMHGYSVSSWQFLRFLKNQEVRARIEKDYQYFSSAMLNVYRATDLMFLGEYELEEARSFSRKVIEKVLSKETRDNKDNFRPINLEKMMENELRNPWIARLDHLEHRTWIENRNSNILCVGKGSFHRLSPVLTEKLMQLAVADYEFRQFIYRNELEEVERWSRSRGLRDMGFGREKTTYCYFAIASSIPLPYDSDIRMMIAKSAIVVTVADDFYDMEGSLDELNSLTDAIGRWDASRLRGHSKTIFDALDDLVGEIVAKVLQHRGTDITVFLQQIWYETFASWLEEAKWSRGGYLPSIDEYLGTGMISIAAHTIILPASCLSNPSLIDCKVRPGEYETVTKLLMLIPRLLNDIQSYQKEQEEGKMNCVLLYLKENPGADIEDSTAYVRQILDKKWGELLQHVLMDGFGDLPKPCKLLHLSCVKVFQMFFHSRNRFDSNTEMLQDIQKAIYIPLNVGTSKPLVPPQKEDQAINSHSSQPSKYEISRSSQLVLDLATV
ncbi:(E,E)-geranyllinalool synthase-like isoform X2 [Herrania umbratica]|uniref:(E,E)-geranyllinalool synthase-like isoform X2 n=1 Tax=Herrania umbratica TaxID=108875 RepID=A0A6J1B685_9ROSI|nr:(E,E)-geranyllinalool synthase-like isoform X2 [Herrania umbratica]